jgi:glycosyltransferase involved in cell wall biosynthesis
MDISVVVPLLNEEESLPELAAWIDRVMQENKFSYEVVFIDDGSRDGSWKVIEGLAAANPNLKGVRFRRNYDHHGCRHAGQPG